MRTLIGVIKDRHGTFYAQQKVPERLQAAVARVLDNGKPRQVYLKKSLGTKDLKTANVVAKHILAGFDRVLQQAEALARDADATPAPRVPLNDAEIRRLYEYVHASVLAYARETIAPAVLQSYAGVLEAIGVHNAGQPVAPSKSALVAVSPMSSGGTLREALEGWKKERERPALGVQEYTRAVEMFIQLHGGLPVVDIKRRHAREFREALQLVPRHRKGALLKASLPELAEWGRKHPEAPKVSPATINKQLGAVQAIAGWGHLNGLVPEDVHWADPFHKMRVVADQSEREPFTGKELQQLFDTPLFTDHETPEGARGEAGVWLPLLALFTGGRQAELAGLRVADVVGTSQDETPLLYIVSDKKAGRRLKNKNSERVVPLHPQLVGMGFLDYVASRRREGDYAWLFPLVAPDQDGNLRAWSKWFGHYLRNTAGVEDTNKVFHSFRHGFKDALRVTTRDEEVRDALLGHGNASVGRSYGAKQMLDRFGLQTLRDAVSQIAFLGLDLSRVRPLANKQNTRHQVTPSGVQAMGNGNEA